MILRPDAPVLYLITQGDATEGNFSEACERILHTVSLAVKEQVALLQIREKNLTTRRLLELATRVVDETRGSRTRVLINDRADVALSAGADGVHLTARSLPAAAIRASGPALSLGNFMIGVSTHSEAQVREAMRGGADFAVYGPVFESPGKAHPTGLGSLKSICEAAGAFPIIGLGGINATNFASALESGTRGIAAIRALNDPESLSYIAAQLRKHKP